MKNKYIFIMLLFITAVIIGCSNITKTLSVEKSFIPDVVSNVYMGMTLDQLKQARGIVNLSVVEGDKLTKVREEYAKDSITLITYQLDKNKILYEIMIEYVPEFDVMAAYKKKYGDLNNGKEWLFTISNSLKLKEWVYLNNLCIANSRYFKN